MNTIIRNKENTYQTSGIENEGTDTGRTFQSSVPLKCGRRPRMVAPGVGRRLPATTQRQAISRPDPAAICHAVREPHTARDRPGIKPASSQGGREVLARLLAVTRYPQRSAAHETHIHRSCPISGLARRSAVRNFQVSAESRGDTEGGGVAGDG